MRTAVRITILLLALTPVVVLVVTGELIGANLVRTCGLGCGSAFSNLEFYSLVAFLFFTPGLLVLFFAAAARDASSLRNVALVLLVASFYAILYFPGVNALWVNSNPIASPLLIMVPVLLIGGMAYLVATSRTPLMIAAVIVGAVLGAALMVTIGARIPGSEPSPLSCSWTEIANASSSSGYTSACVYLTSGSALGFPAFYVLSLTIFATLASFVDLIFVRIFTARKQDLQGGDPLAAADHLDSLGRVMRSTAG